MKPHFAAAVTACLLLAGSAAPAFAAALDCPLPHPEAEPGVIQETPAMIRDFGDMLSSGTSGNDVGTVLQTLKQRFPKASDGEFHDFRLLPSPERARL